MPGITRPANQFHIAGPDLRDDWDAVTGAIEMGRLVKVASVTEVEKTGAGDFEAIGIADRDLRKGKATTYAVGEALPVLYLADGQLVVMIAGAAITAGVKVETGADGKVVTYAPSAIGDSAAAIGISLDGAGSDLDETIILVGRG